MEDETLRANLCAGDNAPLTARIIRQDLVPAIGQRRVSQDGEQTADGMAWRDAAAFDVTGKFRGEFQPRR